MTRFKARYKVIIGIFLLIAIIFLSKLFYIQVVNDDYKFSANNNVLRYDVQQAVRGLIYDRDSNLIVANVPAYDLMIVPRELKNKKIDVSGVEIVKGQETFFWSGKYHKDLNTRTTLETRLNVLENFNPIIPGSLRSPEVVMLGNLSPEIQIKNQI